MSPRMRPLAAGAACVVAGALAWFAFGTGPAVVSPSGAGEGGWQLRPDATRNLAASEALWSERHPWGAVAADPAEEAEAQPPPAIPVGTARDGDGLLAVFLVPDGTTSRLRAGDEIPGGGRVDAVTESEVSWTDPRGGRHEQRLLVDPLPTQANSR